MYCYHCGKKIDEHKIEQSKSSLALPNGNEESFEYDSDTQIEYICPRCGHIIKKGLSEEDSKELSRASHAQIQRANNHFAIGMCMNALGGILLITGLLFYLLAKKPSKGFILQTNCAEWYVFLALAITSVILLVIGIVKTIRGVKSKAEYSQLLKDLNNKTFVQ